MRRFPFFGLCILFLTTAQAFASEEVLKLPELIREALKNNPEIHAAEARANSSLADAEPDPLTLANLMTKSLLLSIGVVVLISF